MILRPRFWIAIALVPLALLALGRGTFLDLVLANVLLLGVAALTHRLGNRAGDLRLERRTDAVLSVRVANRVTLRLTNESAYRIRGRLRDEPPAGCEAAGEEFAFDLAPGATLERTYTVVPPRRGEARFRGAFARVDQPLGLVASDLLVDPGRTVPVYPNLLALRDFDLLNQAGRMVQAGLRRSRQRGIGTEFESLREYQEGDDFRKIDFAASARRDALVVRQYEQERNQAVFLVVDLGRPMLAEVRGASKLDHTLDAMLLLANAAVRAGDQVGLLAYDDRIRRYVPPTKGKAQLRKVIHELHDLQPELAESDPLAAFPYLTHRYKRRALVVVFTDVDDDVRARELAAALAPLRRRHLVFVVRVEDPDVTAARKAPVRTRDDLARRGAVLLLEDERREASRVLYAAGVRNVESPPDRLAQALVGAYLQAKERGEI